MEDLKEIANKTKQERQLKNDVEEWKPTEVKKEEVMEKKKKTSNSPVIYGLNDDDTGESKYDFDSVEEDDEDENLPSLNMNSELTDNDLRSFVPDLDDKTFKVFADSKIKELSKYRKNLIINSGFTIEEATKAIENRLKREGKEVNEEYLEKNPKIGIIEIDKKNVDKIEFTTEEQAKLSKVKSIKMIIVQEEKLKQIKIDKVDKKSKAAYLKAIDGSLAKYSVPLPIIGDYVSFRGAQIMQLASVVKHDDDSTVETITKQATLIYNRLYNGSVINKYDDDNKVILSYQDFINTFKFSDMNMALYGILVASSMEDTEAPLSCPKCEKSFNWKYKVRTLLDGESIQDKFKERIDTILANKCNYQVLKDLNTDYNKAIRLQSPFSQNIYEVSYPSIAKAINVFSTMNEDDITEVYHSGLILFIDNLYVYNKENDNYIQIEEEEIRLLFDTLQNIPQEDVTLLNSVLKDMIFTPQFILKSQCPECGEKLENTLDIDQMIFLLARDSSMEIE